MTRTAVAAIVVLFLALCIPSVVDAATLWSENWNSCPENDPCTAQETICSGTVACQDYGTDYHYIETVDSSKAYTSVNTGGFFRGDDWPAAKAEYWVRFWVKYASDYNWRNATDKKVLIAADTAVGNSVYLNQRGVGTGDLVDEGYWVIHMNSTGDVSTDGESWVGVYGDNTPAYRVQQNTWYCVIMHIKADTAQNGTGEVDLDIYDSNGSLIYDLDLYLRAGTGNKTTYNHPKHDFTHNNCIPACPFTGTQDEWREDITESDTVLTYLARDATPPPAESADVVYDSGGPTITSGGSGTIILE